MKLKVQHRKQFGNEMYYATDDETQRFLNLFGPPARPQQCFTKRQIKELKALGFEIAIEVEKHEV